MSRGINLPRVRAFVEQHGSPLERARLAALQSRAVPREVPPELAVLQNPDGGFPYELQPSRPSSLYDTATTLRWLKALQLADSPVAGGACAFMLSRQIRRGIWRESVDLRQFSPPLWMDPESAAGDVYTTALCARTLVLCADAALALDRAVNWLQAHQGHDGLLEGFKLYASWLAVPAFAHVLGRGARPTRRLAAGLGEALNDAWEPAMLANLLQCLLEAGYGLRTELVVRAWALLQTRQEPDGSFAADEGAESAIDVTLTVLDIARTLSSPQPAHDAG